jgi:hypothetical protein
MNFPSMDDLYDMDLDSLIAYIGDLESEVINLQAKVQILQEKLSK